MREAMTAKYDPSTKLATGTTMAEYKRINMRATTIGMWGGLAAGGLISEYLIGSFELLADESNGIEETYEPLQECSDVFFLMYVPVI